MRWFVPVLALLSFGGQQPEPRFKESVDVRRVLVDVRVVNAAKPVLDLAADDFVVRIDGKRARVDSVQWVGGPHDEPRPDGTRSRGRVVTAPRGRLIVILIQKSLEQSRITGLMRALTETPAFLDSFSSEDRLAVLSFDSHLKVWVDFTNDFEHVRRVLQRGVLVEAPGPVNEADSPSLVERLPPSVAKRTWSIEDALALIGDALAPLPGSKTLVMLGYGFGRLTAGRFPSVMMEPGYDKARKALQAARASVFCLDIASADYHSLEAGLQTVAEDTGGFFVRTHIFTRRAFDHLAAALAGHYVLFVEKPDVRAGVHRIDVKLADRDGSVLVKREYVE